MEDKKMRDVSGNHQGKRLTALLICMLLITSSSLGLLIYSAGNAQAMPTMIELKCGWHFTTFGTNVTIGGLNVPAGCLVEIFDNSTGLSTGKTFKVGDGTEGPNGVFKPGQFDVFTSFDSITELPKYIFLRAYNSAIKATATTFGDSKVIYITASGAFEFQGWTLFVDTTPPSSSVNPISPYWYTASPLAITATATDTGGIVSNVSLYYRFCLDNVSWGAWTYFGIDAISPWGWDFTFPSGEGYYEFYSIAKDNSGNPESAPSSADARAGYDFTTPDIWVQQPNGGEYIAGGSNYTISWEASDNLKFSQMTLSLEYSSDNGGSWNMIEEDLSSWVKKPSMTKGIGGLAAATLDNYIYALGGEDGTEYFSAANRYDITTETWSSIASMNQRRYGLAAVALEGKIYAIGGFNGATYFSSVEAYNPATNTWSYVAPMPTARYYLSAAVYDGKIYAFGGRNATTSWMSTVEIYDPVSNSWSSGANMPTARYGPAAVAVNDKIYVIGGFNGARLMVNQEYDPATNTWAAKALMPTKRVWLSATAVNGKIYAIGGADGAIWITANEEYNPATDTWDSKSPIPLGRKEAGIATYNGYLCVLGGYNVSRLSDMWVYNPFSDGNYIWSVPLIDSNQCLVRINIVDAANNAASDMSNATFTIDSTLPTSYVEAITPYWQNANPLDVIAVADDFNGVASVELWYSYSTDNLTWNDYTLFGTDSEVGDGWSWSFPWPDGDGHYQFYSIAIDVAGNIEQAPLAEDAQCGYDSGSPTIVSTVPLDGSTGVSVTAGTYVVRFSESMDTGVTSFLTNLPGAIGTWNSNGVWFNITYTNLAEVTSYYVEFTGQSHNDLAGNPLTGVMYMDFITGDFTAPTITTIVPNDGATGVALNAQIVVTWSEPMDATVGTVTINPARTGAWVWSGAGDTICTFTPAGNWLENQYYALTFTNFRDDALVAATGDLFKTFNTTFTAPTISTIVPADSATGVALNAQIVVTWSEGMDATVGTVTINPARTGAWVWSGAGDTICTFTPAANWLENRYYTLTFTNFRDDALVAATGDLFKTFNTTFTAPQISTIVPADSASGVALNAQIVVTWSEPMDATVGTVTINPARTGAWVWSGVGDTICTFTPAANWLENRYYTLTFTNFRDDALVAATGDLFKTFNTTFTAPQISTIVPADGATGVALNAQIVVTWSEPMDSTVGTVTINPARTGAWVWSGAGDTICTFTPAGNWLENQYYTLTFANYRDDALVAATGDLFKTFTTGDFTLPTIISTTQADGATLVATTAGTYDAGFSEDMAAVGSVTTNLPGAVGSWVDADTYRITYNALAEMTTYTLTYIGFRDVANNALGGDAVKNFTTGDFTAPTIIATTFTDSIIGVSTAAGSYYADFSENMAVVGSVTTNLPGAVGSWFDANTYRVTYTALAEFTVYTLTYNGFTDVVSNPLGGDTVKNFTTGDFTVPTIITTTFLDGAIGISNLAGTYDADFSEDMAAVGSVTTNLPGAVGSWVDADTYRVTYTVLAELVTYTLSYVGFTDLSGNPLGSDTMKAFTTGDITPPTIVSTVPLDGSTGVTLNQNIIITFSEPMNTTTVTYSITPSPGVISVTWTSGNTVMTIIHNPFVESSGYTVEITAGQDLAGNNLAAGVVSNPWSFTTGDFTSPTSSAGPLPAYVNTLTFDVPFTAADNVGGSGVAYVNLYWKYSTSTIWHDYGAFTTSPISFTASGGGRYYFFTLATDNAGNHEAMKTVSEATTMIDFGPPLAPTNLRDYVHNDGTSTIAWTASTSADIDYYNIYVNTDPYNFNFTTPFATTAGTSWLHLDGGNIAIDYYYIVRSVDIAGNEEANTNAVGKFVTSLSVGWNMFSNPLISPDNTVPGIFGANLTGGTSQSDSDKIFSWDGAKWRVAYYYDDGAGNTGWLYVGGSFNIQPDKGYWLYIMEDPLGDYPNAAHPPKDITLTGTVPGTRSVSLSVGWNLVGYTSLRTVTLQSGTIDSASGLLASGFTGGTSQATSDRVFSWTGSGWQVLYMWTDGTWLGTTSDLEPGCGYWIEIQATHSAFVWNHN